MREGSQRSSCKDAAARVHVALFRQQNSSERSQFAYEIELRTRI